MAKFEVRLAQGSALATMLIVAACGGGGGVNSTPSPPISAPTPTPTPAPTPTPTPAPSSYDTAEYRATVGAVSMNALAAYQQGATGKDIKIGFVDSGIDLADAAFAGRIDPASGDVAGSRGLSDEGGHGTAVAFTAAGARNGVGAQGVAFDATLIVMRADTPGSCAESDNSGNPDCSFNDTAIASGISRASQNGARVINISLGGDAPSQDVLNAIAAAAAKGVIVVIAAGNDSAANPDPFADVPAKAATSHNMVIIAGSVGSNDLISDFSNKAGDGADHYLAAVGDNVLAPCPDSTNGCLWSGTSFAAPQISGAVALLAQAFPNLTGADIVNILFSSARDAGLAGVDSVYGHGILDLTRAFEPRGTTSIASTTGTVSLLSNAVLSAPMGDAAQGPLGAVLLDGFDRAYAIDLAHTISAAGPYHRLTGALATRDRYYQVEAGRLAIAVTIAGGRNDGAINRLLLSPDQAREARAIAASVTTRLGSNAQFALGFSQSGATLAARLEGRNDPAFLIARDPSEGAGFLSDSGAAAAMRQRLGHWGLTTAIETGDVLAPVANAFVVHNAYRRFGYTRALIAADRRFGPLAVSFGASWLDEQDTVLGAHFSSGLGNVRATSWFIDSHARLGLGDGWSLNGAMRQGRTLVTVRAGLAGSGTLRTDSYAASVSKDAVLGMTDNFSIGIAQPLRVAAGAIALHMPVYYDYAAGSVSKWADERLNLAPTGREIDVEARYAFALFNGTLVTHLFWRRQPGNFADLPSDRGVALRYGVTF